MGLVRVRNKAALCLLAAALLLPDRAPSLGFFFWPDPLTHPRVILYADQGLADYMRDNPDWFADDTMIGGLFIKDVAYGDSSSGVRAFDALRTDLMYKQMQVGTYISGTTVAHEDVITKYPADAVAIEDISVKTKFLGPWLRDPSQQVVDLSDVGSRLSLEGGINQLWAHVPAFIRFVDNAAVHPRVAAMQPWENYCINMTVLTVLAASHQTHLIFNVFARPWELSDQETVQLINAVGFANGVSFPLPWSLSIKDDKRAAGWAVYRYRQLLDKGIAVILIPSKEAPAGELSKWIATWRRSTDPLYIAAPYWDEPIF
jgi:hypothetical protein